MNLNDYIRFTIHGTGNFTYTNANRTDSTTYHVDDFQIRREVERPPNIKASSREVKLEKVKP